MPRKTDEHRAALCVEPGDSRFAWLGGYAMCKNSLICRFVYEIRGHILFALRASAGYDHYIAVFLGFFYDSSEFVPVVLYGDSPYYFEALFIASRGYSVCIYVSYLPGARHGIRTYKFVPGRYDCHLPRYKNKGGCDPAGCHNTDVLRSQFSALL